MSSCIAFVYAQRVQGVGKRQDIARKYVLEVGCGLGLELVPSAEYFYFGWVFWAHAGEGRMVQLSLQMVLCSSPSTGFLADEPEVCENRAVLPAEHHPGLLCKEHPRPL